MANNEHVGSEQRPDRDLAAALRQLITVDARITSINNGRSITDLRLGQFARIYAHRDPALGEKFSPFLELEKSRAGLAPKRKAKALSRANAELGARVRWAAVNDPVVAKFVASFSFDA